METIMEVEVANRDFGESPSPTFKKLVSHGHHLRLDLPWPTK